MKTSQFNFDVSIKKMDTINFWDIMLGIYSINEEKSKVGIESYIFD